MFCMLIGFEVDYCRVTFFYSLVALAAGAPDMADIEPEYSRISPLSISEVSLCTRSSSAL